MGINHEPVADIAQHLERRRPRADDHRRAQPHHVRTAVDAQARGRPRRGWSDVRRVRRRRARTRPDTRSAGPRRPLRRWRHWRRRGCRRRGSPVGRCRAPGNRRRRWDRRRRMPLGRGFVARVQRDSGDLVCQPKSASRSGFRVAATTSWPSSSSALTSREPTYPVAPVTRIRTVLTVRMYPTADRTGIGTRPNDRLSPQSSRRPHVQHPMR